MDFKELRKKNLALTKKKIRESVNEDSLIINAVNSLEEIDKVINSLSMRLRDWFSLVNPEFEDKVSDHHKLCRAIINSELPLSEMGADIGDDFLEIKSLAISINTLFENKLALNNYLERIISNYAPNLYILIGTSLTAKFLREAKSLRNLAFVQSSTIQLFGAEKALFRHLKSGSRPPKYGFILNHQLVQNSKNKAAKARSLAGKISICAKLDYFKGEIKANEYLEQLK